ncbi:MAG: alpha-isopropylmalate synthase regulatory domain-containing protein [Ilumatobacteraceae bacterium]
MRRFELVGHELHTRDRQSTVTAQIVVDGEHRTVVGKGGGPIDAFVHGLREAFGAALDVVDYAEHAIGKGSDATAAAYVETTVDAGTARWGIGLDDDITTASLKAVLTALERQLR